MEKTYTIRVSADIRRRLRELAYKGEISISAVVEEILRRELGLTAGDDRQEEKGN